MSGEPHVFDSAETGRPRVLIVENEEIPRELNRKLLEKWGFETFVAEAEGDYLIEEAYRLAREGRCHLALVDMRLIDDTADVDFSGIEIAKNLPQLLSIIISGYFTYDILRDGIYKKWFHSYIGKHESPVILQEQLNDAAQLICANWRGLQIEPQAALRESILPLYRQKEQECADEIDDLLARLFPDAEELQVKIITPGGDMSVAPRPRSRILEVRADNFQPVLVKVARATKIRQEVENYKKHVEGRLKGDRSPPLRNFATRWYLGGNVYGYAGATAFKPFSEYYREAEAKDINWSLNQFFRSTWADLYKKEGKEDQQVFDAYQQVLGKTWFEDRLRQFKKEAAVALPQISNVVDLPHPIDWLIDKVEKGVGIPGTKLKLTHGDLHGDNILVDNHKNIWVIDFERTGYGPALQDCTELEVDIICRLTKLSEIDHRSSARLFTWAVWHKNLVPALTLSSGSPVLNKVTNVLANLRQIANTLDPNADTRVYFWGLLINMLFRVSILDPETASLSIQRVLLFASIVCYRLDHWEENWLPGDWPQIID